MRQKGQFHDKKSTINYIVLIGDGEMESGLFELYRLWLKGGIIW